MKASNFLKENNARHIWHPMGHPGKLQKDAPAIITGYFPFGATMIADAVAEVFETAGAEGFIGHGYTYSAHPIGAAGAVACLAETKRLQVKDNAAARGTQLYEGMLHLQERHDLIGDVRGGHGLMTAIELVSDRGTKAPVSPDIALNVQKLTYENGAMLRASGPTLIISPPLIIPREDAETIVAALDEALSSI